MSSLPNLDDLVQSVSLYRRIPTIFHLYVLPFIIIYVGWFYVWCGIYGFWEHYEGGFVGLAAIACVQILCCLACYWSVHINCFFSCKKVTKLEKLPAFTLKFHTFCRKKTR